MCKWDNLSNYLQVIKLHLSKYSIEHNLLWLSEPVSKRTPDESNLNKMSLRLSLGATDKEYILGDRGNAKDLGLSSGKTHSNH
jgi:hypothetical protein